MHKIGFVNEINMKMNKVFDCVKMMRDIRDKMNPELIKMNPDQIMEYFRKKSIEFEKKYGKTLTTTHNS